MWIYDYRISMGKISSLPTKKRTFILFIMVFVLLYYLTGIFYPDGNIIRHRNDELHFHIPAIKKIADSNIPDTFKDYPTATFPLYHLLMAPIYNSWPDDLWILRFINLILTVFTALLIYYYFLNCIQTTTFYDRSVFAFSISLTFIMSPYVRASALSVTTDNLPYLFIMTGLIMLAYYDRNRKMILLPLVALSGFLAFYSRQNYIWVPVLFFIQFLRLKDVRKRSKILYLCSSILFIIPAVYFIKIWGSLIPPAFQLHHEASRILMMIPFVFAFIPFYFIPLYLLFFQDIKNKTINGKKLSLIILPGFVFCFFYIKNSFSLGLVDGGGVLGLILSVFPKQYAALLFLIFSYFGVVSIVILFLKYPSRNYIWIMAIFPFLFSRVFWQKYFDPLIIILVFITMSSSIKARLVKTRVILLYPVMEILLFVIISILYLKKLGLP